MVTRLTTAPEDTRGKISALFAGPLGPLISDIFASHVETGKKAVRAAQQGEPTKAGLYGVATAVPGLGPMAASTAETAFGTPARYENGQLVEAEQPPQPGRAGGQLLGNIMIGGLTEGALETGGMVGNVGRSVKAGMQNKYLKRTLNPWNRQPSITHRGRAPPGTAPRIQLSPGTAGSKFHRAEALTQNSRGQRGRPIPTRNRGRYSG
jgi:hypothetical protein